MPELVIGHKVIRDGGPAFVIAEIGHNHQGSLETCLEMVRVAASCGVDAVKLQKRTLDPGSPHCCYTKAFLATPYNSEHAYGDTYGAHRAALEFGMSEYQDIQAYCDELDICFIATAFDEEAADFLYAASVDAIKIASGDLTNTPLLGHVAALRKPVIVSTGGGTFDDIIRADRSLGDTPGAFLHCVARYPLPPEEANLAAIGEIRKRLPGRIIGYSCHQSGVDVAEQAYGKWGATIIEKHFTLNHAWKGSDQAMSLEPSGMRALVRNLRRCHEMDGTGEKGAAPEEQKALAKMAKVLWPVRTLPPGHMLGPKDIAARSPAVPGGLPPWRIDEIIGLSIIHGASTSEPFKEEDQ